MSIQAVGWVLDNSEATYADRLVLIAIANHIGPTGWSWPSIAAIAGEARVDRSTVFRAIDNLVNMGELAIMRRPGKPNFYGLAAFTEGSQSATPEGSHPATPGVASARREGSQSATQTIKNHKEPKPARACERPEPTPALTADERRRGGEYFRGIRLGKSDQ